MTEPMRVLKEDALGIVLLVEAGGDRHVRREVRGGAGFGTRVLARLLIRRERTALMALDGLPGVPRIVVGARQSMSTLTRSYLPGEPLWAVTSLPRNYFDLLDALVSAIHDLGVCHNDLHKENNLLVQPDGRPAIVDFQLATVHPRRGRVFKALCREDHRHVEKHRCSYECAGRRSNHAGTRRPRIAALWLSVGKPVWNRVRGVLGVRRPEPRRPRSGPWPSWTPPVDPLS